MGICIGYRGKLRDPAIIPALVTDLQERAEALGWPCKTMEQLTAEGRVTCTGLQGITLYPHPESEPLHFHFDHDGHFVNHFYAALLQDPAKLKMMADALSASMRLMQGDVQGDDKPRKRRGARGNVTVRKAKLPPDPDASFFQEGSLYCWTKTQFAGAEVHMAVCDVLRHVQQRYAPELEVMDDSKYYDTGDKTKLEAELAYVSHLVDVTAEAFQAVASSPDRPTSIDGLLERVNAELADAKNRLH